MQTEEFHNRLLKEYVIIGNLYPRFDLDLRAFVRIQMIMASKIKELIRTIIMLIRGNFINGRRASHF